VALGHERNCQARADPATPDHDHVHATAQHATRRCAKRGAPEQVRVCSYAGAVAPRTGPRPPVPLSGIAADTIPERRRYRLKNKLLGPPLVTEQLSSERLGRPTALGVLAPDCISSSAYGTEEMLTQLVPAVGLAAFSLLVPITIAILGVLFFVTLSYLDVIQYYTKAGGAYVVARDNFGPRIAQIAAVALLIDYTVTVAVQTAAGTAALTSAVPSLANTFDTVVITVGVVLLLLYGNLRGIREAGKFFAFPMYFYVASLGTVVVAGYIKEALGSLHHIPLPPHSQIYGGHLGTPGHGLLMGLAFITLLRAFANGGSSLTGLEAISNGVGSFRRPASVHARQTLIVMSSVLGFLVLGTTLLARWTHAVPYAKGSPTVVSQEVQAIFGRGFIYFVVQLATLLILYTGGNTSFNGFPFLANFVAGDHYLPRSLTRRGHRLAFSNGILVLAAVSIALVLAFKAQVDGLVSLYAIGVFTGFTMAGAGMVKHHLTRKGAHWRRSVVVNGFSSFLSGVVVLIFAVAKFKEGAWVVVVVGPLLYLGLIRLHRQCVRGARPAPARGRGAGRPARYGHRPRPAVRPHPHARRPARRALRHRLQGGPRPRGGVGSSRAGPAPARHHRVPRPPTRPGRHRAGGRRHPRRGHRVHRPVAPPGLLAGLAALPARPHSRQDRQPALPGAPRGGHHHPLQPPRPVRREGAPLWPVGAAGPAQGRRRRRASPPDRH
jgi:amino acid transporter